MSVPRLLLCLSCIIAMAGCMGPDPRIAPRHGDPSASPLTASGTQSTQRGGTAGGGYDQGLPQ
ncbi:hypothetical protein [Gluconacetobacter entanii]|uniref:hypothetical protein n=1 Tax=Gluconacetobacter entanii TaxID=108528 RepID=UPI001C12D460|nr:hypothetical protein [Gluconacetobacter entanii]